jgi:hypothetical protein
MDPDNSHLGCFIFVAMAAMALRLAFAAASSVLVPYTSSRAARLLDCQAARLLDC